MSAESESTEQPFVRRTHGSVIHKRGPDGRTACDTTARKADDDDWRPCGEVMLAWKDKCQRPGCWGEAGRNDELAPETCHDLRVRIITDPDPSLVELAEEMDRSDTGLRRHVKEMCNCPVVVQVPPETYNRKFEGACWTPEEVN